MNKYLSLLVVCALAFSGCTKNKGTKSTTKKKEMKTEATTKAAANEVPQLFNYENQDLLADGAVAFAEGTQAQSDDQLVASSKNVQNEIDQLISLWEEEVPAADAAADKAVVAQAATSFKPVQFELNRANVRDSQELALQEDIEQALAAVDQGKELVVKGHCCPTGPESFNMALSQKRAEAVRAKLIKAGVPAEKVQAVGLGFSQPIVASQATDRATLVQELAPNRRSQIELL